MKLIVDKNKQGFETKEFREYLKTFTPKTEITQQEADELKQTLIDALAEYGGLGISATQIGIKKRACLIKFGDEEIFLLNPQVIERSNDGFVFVEGCLSIPSSLRKPLRTIRANMVKVMTDNLGEVVFQINPEQDKEVGGVGVDTMKTVIAQHEIDHLDGITIRDRVYSTTFVKEVSYGRNEKIVMKSKDGDLIEVKSKHANKYFLQGYEIA